MPHFVIRRQVGWEKKETRYTIYVDGEERGTIVQGQQVKIEVPPGRRSLQFRMGRYASHPIEMSMVDGKDELIECKHELLAVPAFLGKLFAPKDFIKAKRRGTGFSAS